MSKRKLESPPEHAEDSDARQSELQPLPATGDPAAEAKMQLLPRAVCGCWSIDKHPPLRTFPDSGTVVVCKRSRFSNHDAQLAMRQEWDRQEDARLRRKQTCLMKRPGVCHCWHCVPPVPAHDVQLPEHEVHYYHCCHMCLDNFRCIPALPPCEDMPPSSNVACRCLIANCGGTRDPRMRSYTSFFCSNLCFWARNSPSEYYSY